MPLVVCGDLNIHVACMSQQDARLERPIDREIWALLTSAAGFNLQRRNPLNVPTHRDGAVLDHILSHESVHTEVTVIQARDLLGSDHHPVKAHILGSSVLACEAPMLGKACWRQRDCWDEALEAGHESLMFISAWSGNGWATVLARGSDRIFWM